MAYESENEIRTTELCDEVHNLRLPACLLLYQHLHFGSEVFCTYDSHLEISRVLPPTIPSTTRFISLLVAVIVETGIAINRDQPVLNQHDGNYPLFVQCSVDKHVKTSMSVSKTNSVLIFTDRTFTNCHKNNFFSHKINPLSSICRQVTDQLSATVSFFTYLHTECYFARFNCLLGCILEVTFKL